MAICGNNISGSTGNCVDIVVSPNGQIKANFKTKSFVTPALCNNITLTKTSVPASLDNNVLLCGDGGASVMAAKTNSIILFRDCNTNELKGDVIVKPSPTGMACDPVQPDRNVLKSETDGLSVMAQGLPVGVTQEDTVQNQAVFTFRDCATGELRAYLQPIPEITNGACSPTLNSEGKVIYRNAFQVTSAGAGVLVSADESGCVASWVDCDSHEIRSKLVIQPDKGCDCTVANSRGINALICTGTGAAVNTSENIAGGVRTFFDCATQTLQAEIIISPDPTASNCTTNPKTNALRLTPTGLSVLVGKSVEGCIETFVSCDTESLNARLIIKPNEDTAVGATVLTPQNGLVCTNDGAAVLFENNTDGCVHLFFDPLTKTVKGKVNIKAQPSGSVCDGAVLKNALRCTTEGLEVPVGDTNCIDMFVDCPTGEIRSNLKIETTKALECSTNGLKLKLAEKSPDGACPNGLVLLDDGLSAYGRNAAMAAHAGRSEGQEYIYRGVAPTSKDLDEITLTMTNPTCKTMAGMIFFRAPSGIITNPGGNQCSVAYVGSYTVGTVSPAVGETYIHNSLASKVPFSGQTEYRQVTIAPGGSFSAKMKVVLNFTGTDTTPLTANIQSYSIDAILFNVDYTI